MRSAMAGRCAFRLIALALLSALMAAGQDRVQVRILKMDLKTVRTPRFPENSNPEASSLYEWLQVYVEYETSGARRGWADEVTIDWAVLVRPSNNSKPLLLRQTSAYIDVEDGKHRAVVYVRPGFVRRHCDTKTPNKSHFAAYAEISVDGKRLAREDYSRSNQPKNWWNAKEPDVRMVDNELLLPADTPFASMDYDYYEAPKLLKRP